MEVWGYDGDKTSGRSGDESRTYREDDRESRGGGPRRGIPNKNSALFIIDIDDIDRE